MNCTKQKKKKKKRKEKKRKKEGIFSMFKAGSVEYPSFCLGISVALSVPVLRYATAQFIREVF